MTTTRRDDLLPSGSRWRRIEHRDVVDSTNRILLDLAREGEEPGLVLTTDHQTAGRGRRGRAWDDRPGRSALLSALVDGDEFEAALAPLVAGLAVRDAVTDVGAAAELKWPNDVLLAGTKTAGILVEALTVNGAVRLVAGIGVNVDWRDAPATPDRTSVAAFLDADVDRDRLVSGVLAALDARLSQAATDPARLRADYEAACTTIGRDVRVETPSATVAGRAAGVDDRGALLVDTGDGRVTIDVGDVTHVETDAPPNDPQDR